MLDLSSYIDQHFIITGDQIGTLDFTTGQSKYSLSFSEIKLYSCSAITGVHFSLRGNQYLNNFQITAETIHADYNSLSTTVGAVNTSVLILRDVQASSQTGCADLAGTAVVTIPPSPITIRQSRSKATIQRAAEKLLEFSNIGRTEVTGTGPVVYNFEPEGTSRTSLDS
jgi:hypothetical protein